MTQKPEKTSRPRRLARIMGVTAFLLLTAGISVYALALLLIQSELPERVTSLEPVRDIGVEQLFQRLAQENEWDQTFSPVFLPPANLPDASSTTVPDDREPTLIDPVGEAAITRITLSEKALNRQLVFLFRSSPPRIRGLEQIYLTIEPDGLTLLGVMDGRELLGQMAPERRHLLPTLFRRAGLLRIRFTARKDLIGRTWLQPDSASFGHLPVPIAIIHRLMEAYLPESTFDAEDGFFVSRHLESLFFGKGFVTFTFTSPS